MSNRPFPSYQTELDQWLNGLGFSRGNPFATAEADQERALLPEFFVDVEGYERIKGNKTIIVFAPRGGGKSALRVVLASQAAPIVAEAATLAVEFTDFDALIAKQRDGKDIAIDDYVPRLLRTGVRALLDTFCGDLNTEADAEKKDLDRRARAHRAAAVSPPTRSRLAHLLRQYYPSLLEPAALYERLTALDSTFAPAWPEFFEAMVGRRLGQLVGKSVLSTDKRAGLLADLNDYPETPVDIAATATEAMESFVRLARAVELAPVQFLIDRLDELEETVDAPQTQADLLEPLLAHLPLLETAGLAFKFFLSREARDILMGRPTIRRDRLTDQAVTVSWRRDQLKYMLDERLAVYSDGQIYDLTQLCQETWVEVGPKHAPALLGTWIENELLQIAQGSPRRLLIAGQLLCQAHVRQHGAVGLLEQADWEIARIELMKKIPPMLRLRRDSRTVRVGDREMKLTSQQQKILLTLASNGGYCSREMLVEAVWDTSEGVSEEAIDRAIGRLRAKLRDDPGQPVYLRTERGEGFKLLHYEVE